MNPVAKLIQVVAAAAVVALALSAGAGAKGGKPDLAVTRMSQPPARATAGTRLRLVVKVANKGAAPAGTSKLAVYLGKGRKHGKKDKLLKAAKVRALPPGRTARRKLKLRLPGSANGTYRLIACVEVRHRATERKAGNDCRASRKLSVAAKPGQAPAPPSPSPAPGPATPPAAAAPAFTATDDVDWGRVEKGDGSYPDAGTPIRTTLRAAAGLPGQAGYTRSEVAPASFVVGPGTSFVFDEDDDGQITVELPFAFPFGGVDEHQASVGTNGWLGFGTSPAINYWGPEESDYRGIAGVVGEFYRGLMPFWDDLLVGSGDEVREVVPFDESYVAFEWEVQELFGGTARSFQVVLFPDGSFRFDYPGSNEAGNANSFVGYSLGTGTASLETVAVDETEAPSSSLLFTPKPLASNGSLPAGNATLTLPRGSSLIEAPGCSLAEAPTPLSAGSVSCSFPELGPGQQVERAVTYSVPPDAPGQTAPENFKSAAEYKAGSYDLTDRDEVPLLGLYMESRDLNVEVDYASAAPTVGTETEFLVHVASSPSTSLDEPELTLTTPANASLDSVEIGGDPLRCGPLSGGSITCSLPSGITSATVAVAVTPTSAGSPLTLGALGQALNTPAASASGNSPAVGA